MTEERPKRKLTAILSADAKGYSRLMGEDEKATVETLKQSRVVFWHLVQEDGWVLDSPGDNIMVDFKPILQLHHVTHGYAPVEESRCLSFWTEYSQTWQVNT